MARYTVPTVQKPEGLMVWAAMKANGAICLRRCPPQVNSLAYQSILQSAMRFIKPRYGPLSHRGNTYPSVPFCSGRGWTFQQDGASAHRANSTTYWLQRKRVARHNGGVWPPMSPDMNPIEHLWPWVLRRLEGAVFTGREQLWTALQEAFAAVPASYVNSLYASLPHRMQAVIAARGGPTRY